MQAVWPGVALRRLPQCPVEFDRNERIHVPRATILAVDLGKFSTVAGSTKENGANAAKCRTGGIRNVKLSIAEKKETDC